MYNILEVHIEYRNKKLFRVIVLVEISRGDIRAIFCGLEMPEGYDSIVPDEPVNEALMQRVAGFGRQIDIDNMGKYFPGWRKKWLGSRLSKPNKQ